MIQKVILIDILIFFFINLLIITYLRNYLTVLGIQIIFILLLLIIFIFCIYYWKFFILEHLIETFSFKLNNNYWISIDYKLYFQINVLSFLFLLLVVIIGLSTNIYILNYFKEEQRNEEFILLINWFIFSMIFFVISSNLFTIFLGWELIGLTSFLLINFWKFKVTTLNCSFKAFIFNKISDIFILISFGILWNTYKSNNVDEILSLISFNMVNGSESLFYSGLFMIIGCSIKSAQLIGHFWLPDSMEAPLPASALIHSATLVSAGIYLILKFNIIFYYTNLYNIIFFIGSITAFYGGVVAANQTDIKKLLAYSTISHCGFIFMSLSFNNFIITITYLYLHGLYKALVFFCVGSLVKFNNTQDMRQMGSLKTQIVNIVMLIISAINLCGLPYTFGYLYKDLILQLLIINPVYLINYGLLVCGMLSSIVYVYKLIYYSCFDFRKGDLNLIVLYLQNNVFKSKYLFITFTFCKYIAFIIVFLFSIIFFIIVKYYILKNYIFIYNNESIYINELLYLLKYSNSYSYLFNLYYLLFTLTIIILFLQNWRVNYFFFENFNFFLQLFLFIFLFKILIISL